MSYVVNRSEQAYGPEAKSALASITTTLHELTKTLTERLFDGIESTASVAEITSRLRPNEFRRLKSVQADYLRLVLSRELTAGVHRGAAEKAGLAHTLAGVDMIWTVESYRFYEREIGTFLRRIIPEAERREYVMAVVSERFLIDLTTQLESSKRVAGAVAEAFREIDQIASSAGTLPDLIREALKVIGELPGGVGVFFARADEEGVLRIEHYHTDLGAEIHQAFETGEAPQIRTDPNSVLGNSPAGRAWRSGIILKSDAWLIEPDKKPWRALAKRLGVRSSAAVPMLDEHGNTMALVGMYSRWPGYFSSEIISSFLINLQNALGHALQRLANEQVVPLRDQQTYRRQVGMRRVIIHYQPIISLRTGKLIKVEGLARLQCPGGGLLPPGKFLAALGRSELLELFGQGMEQVCAALKELEAKGIRIGASINLPAEGLEDPRYERMFLERLSSSQLSPDRFHLELLEDKDAGGKRIVHRAFIDRMKAIGVSIAQDDLGSGHSSLLRLDQYPFDEIKIDQGLVRGALTSPKRAVDFIMHLTRLAHAFDTKVTVEGLENTGMIEAAAILGADYGQGYGIARPMQIDQLVTWHKQYVYELIPNKPKTALGALAGCMLWDLQISAIPEGEELVGDFDGPRVALAQFIQANSFGKSRLGDLLERSQKVVTSLPGRTESSRVRSELIRELADCWLEELRG